MAPDGSAAKASRPNHGGDGNNAAERTEQEAEAEGAEKDGSAPFTAEELEASDLLELARDKMKSRLLQRSLLRGGSETAAVIYKKALPIFVDLVLDQYGNYLSQKILEVVSEEEFEEIFTLLRGRLLELAEDAHGTRGVQKVIEQAAARSRVTALLDAMPLDLVAPLARHPSGFHVVARLLDMLPKSGAPELLERLVGSSEEALSLSKDQWGCCVLKKCVDRAEGPTRQMLVDTVADNALELVQDPFGNYVVQHVILMSTARQNHVTTRVIDALRGQAFELSLQKFSSNVLEKCLVAAGDRDRDKIINGILTPPTVPSSEAVRMLFFHPFGNYVLQQALDVAREPQFSLLVRHCRPHVQTIMRQAAESPLAPSPEAQEASAAPEAPAGSLAPEHSRRLAAKLAKKYPSLGEGLDTEAGACGGGSMWAPSWFDPYTAGCGGFAPYGWGPATAPQPGYGFCFPAMDPSAAWQPLQPPPKGGGGGGSGGRGSGRGNKGGGASKRKKSARRSSSAAPNGPRAGAGVETARVGRVVGFWPNYTVTYDEVPTQTMSGSGRKGRSKRSGGRGRGAGRQREPPAE